MTDKLNDVVIFKTRLEEAGIELPKNLIFIISDFEEQVPKEYQGHIEVEAYGCTVISKKVYEQYLKEKLK